MSDTIDPKPKDLPGDVMEIQMGPSHPAMHGIVKLDTKFSGETVVDMEVGIGYLHRGFEKMCEHRTWNQNQIFTDRLNYVSSPANNCAYASAVEMLAEIEITDRCKWMRVIVSEMARICDHLTCVAASVMELGGFSVYLYFIQAREELMMIFDKICGSRLTTTLARVGGMSHDMYDGWQNDLIKALEKTRTVMEDGHIMITRNRIFYDRMHKTGIISAEDAIDWGFTGPSLRSTGVDYDIRKAKPYWTYDQVEFEVPTGDRGDNYDRYLIRMEEMEQSMRILEQAMDKIPEGELNINDKKVTLSDKSETYHSIEGLIHHFEVTMYGPKIPKGEVYFAIEAPNGEHGYFLVSDGRSQPYRMRARPTCLPMTMCLPKLCIGGQLADIVPTFGSVNMIGGELER